MEVDWLVDWLVDGLDLFLAHVSHAATKCRTSSLIFAHQKCCWSIHKLRATLG